MINHKIHRLPVMVDGKVIGIITVTDLAEHLRRVLLIGAGLEGQTLLS
jgi:CBS domain-containing protein